MKLLDEVRQAYEFSPNSFTNSALHAALREAELPPGDKIVEILDALEPSQRAEVFAFIGGRWNLDGTRKNP